mmetsp:Transcript_27819/g.47100  ORF Transcript_27819/g.47100 Transcript_27819/m.47100 type:complete len:669 (-) Transcript_27819:178-2184(-)
MGCGSSRDTAAANKPQAKTVMENTKALKAHLPEMKGGESRQAPPATTTTSTNKPDKLEIESKATNAISSSSTASKIKTPEISEDQQVPELEPYKGGSDDAKEFVILHFNDVYNIQPVNEKSGGGASRFYTMVEKYRSMRPLILFSGDCFAPSVMSTITHGKHMPPVLNKIGIHVSMYGNHDFDFGEEKGMELTKSTKFPWLLSNIFRLATGERLGDALDMVMVKHCGMKVGIFGVAEDWTNTLPTLPEGGVRYVDFVQHSRKMVAKCKSLGADLVIALTHSRIQNDELLAKKVQGIDLILGGHDHLYAVEQIEPYRQVVVKSGSDFHDMTIIRVKTDSDRLDTKDGLHGARATFVTERIIIGPEVPKHPEMESVVKELSAETDKKFSVVMGRIECDLDCSFEVVRKEECAVGNFLADLIRQAYGCDIGYMVGGGIRSNQVFPKGPFTFKDIMSVLPFQDPCGVVRITGAQLVKCLEHGLRSYPKLDGRFPHVSGIRFVHDPSKPAGSRVVKVVVVRADGSERALDMKEKYKVATRGYLVQGGDGYQSFSEGEVLVGDEQGHSLSFLLRNFFLKIDAINSSRLRRTAHASIKQSAEEAKKSFDSENNNAKKVATPEKLLVVHPKAEGRCLTLEGAGEGRAKSHHDALSRTMIEVGDFINVSEGNNARKV